MRSRFRTLARWAAVVAVAGGGACRRAGDADAVDAAGGAAPDRLPELAGERLEFTAATGGGPMFEPFGAGASPDLGPGPEPGAESFVSMAAHGGFESVGAEVGEALAYRVTAAGDLDGDGLDEYLCGDGRGRLFHRERDGGPLRDVAQHAGLRGASGAAVMADFDLDGDLDLATAAGAWRNLGGLRFEAAGEAWGLAGADGAVGAVGELRAADLDGDGDPDLVVGERALRNGTDGSRVVIDLVDRGGGPGAGALVEISARGFERAAVSDSEGRVAIGLADRPGLEFSVRIRWPDGSGQAIEGLAPDHRFTVRGEYAEDGWPAPEGRGQVAAAPPFAPPEEIAAAADGWGGGEAGEIVLPGEGPAFAWGDFDNDADPDLFVGGGAGSAGVLWRNEGGGAFAEVPCAALRSHAACVDTAARFLDIDRDGDADLYVASGGGGLGAGDERLHDRLYLNDGSGGFIAADADALPDVRDVGSCVRGADFDGDGDLDLFVGGRTLPGEYPQPGNSRLLVNESPEGGPVRLYEAPGEAAPGLRQCGMVLDALWADFDGDTKPDLFLVCERAAPQLYLNAGGGRLTPHPGGLAERVGAWRCARAADLDGDGDTDLLLGNSGRSEAEPPAGWMQESVILSNDGAAGFAIKAMPWGAQIAPVTGFALAGLGDGGGWAIAVAQGIGEEPGGAGALFLPDGEGGFGDGAGAALPWPCDARGLHALDVDGDTANDLLCVGAGGELFWRKG